MLHCVTPQRLYVRLYHIPNNRALSSFFTLIVLRRLLSLLRLFFFSLEQPFFLSLSLSASLSLPLRSLFILAYRIRHTTLHPINRSLI